MTQPRLKFGTDGVRGVFGEGFLTEASIVRLGLALGDLLTRAKLHDQPVLLGGDTRASRADLTEWFARGLASRGVACVDAGVLPTAGLALLCEELGAGAAAVVSASHNPARDNGIKLFEAGAGKLSDEVADRIEQRWSEVSAAEATASAAPAPCPDAVERYVRRLRAAIPELSLEGMRIAVDAAHGAAYVAAPTLLRGLGADVRTRSDQPDGTNINLDCGALHPEHLAADVAASGADFGVAFDGDADRAIFVDATGAVVHGDAVLAILAEDLAARGALPGSTVVGTVMSNFGLERFLRTRDMALERTPVGDRFIAERLRSGGFALGGEPSGHVIFGADLECLGDGPYTALRIADLIRRSGHSLAELAARFEPTPQVLLGRTVGRKTDLFEISGYREKLAAAEESLGGEGRVLIRYSGTEPKIRVMVEGTDRVQIEALAQDFAEFLEANLG